MTLYRRILIGITIVSICLIGLAVLSAQLILTNGYRQIEEANATQNVQRVANVLQNDIESLKVDDIEWIERPPPPPRYVPQYPGQNIANDNLLNKISLATKLNIALLLDRENNIVFRNAVDMETEETHDVPQFLLASIKSGSPLLAGTGSSTILKGIVALPQGLLMTISVPVYPRDHHDKNWGRLIAGRYIDEDEIQHIADSTKLDVDITPYNDLQIPGDFQIAKSKLDEGHNFYVDSGSASVVSSYMVLDDIYGKPALILKAQMPRTIYQHGQENVNSFFAALILIVFLLASALFLFLERTILVRLVTLNTGLGQIKLLNNFILEVPTSGNDEITTLTSSVKQILKEYSGTQSQLEDTKQHLENRVLERTVELSSTNSRLEGELNEQKQAYQVLTQTRDKAISDLQLKSQLLANVSHDSRTPLTIIGLNTEMLQQGRHGELNSKQSEVLDRILNATRQLLHFITNMLDEAQLKNGKMSFVNVTFEPKLLIEEFVSMLEPLASAKGIKLEAEIDLALPGQIKGDPDRFKQILTNLAENAIKFTDEGCVIIRALRTDSQHWVIQVSDTGRGIPLDAQNRIFEAYWQLNSTSKQGANRGGVGLGLSIVKQIVQLMNGSITVESKIGQGTTFTVTLPIVRDQEKMIVEPLRQINI
jgi:signal transduction histidine kinase